MLNLVKVFIFFICLNLSCGVALAETSTVLSAGISLSEQVPVDFMGTWRVVSKLSETDSPVNFKKMGVDLWNLSRTGNVINLCNPMSGASASVNVEYVKDNTVRFTKEGNYDNQKLTDTVEITLNGDKFTGVNYLSLKTFSSADNSLVTEKTATYNLQGDKISGTSILER